MKNPALDIIYLENMCLKKCMALLESPSLCILINRNTHALIVKALKKPATKAINNKSKKIPSINPIAAKTTKLVKPAATQIRTDGKKAKNDPTAITSTKKKFISIRSKPTSKETSK